MGVIPISHLRNAQLSVYRSGGPHDFEHNDVIKQMRKVEEQGSAERPKKLHSILKALALEIRSIYYQEDNERFRCFLIVDECVCDQNGNKHPAHAHIGFCSELSKLDEGDEDQVFSTWAQEQLKLTMEQNIERLLST
ncbi:MAG: hypothetical protein NXI02_03105 [Rhodobacteraceae bacterium]|nr:hypothetical protein [Paracoccaceae bacterium]